MPPDFPGIGDIACIYRSTHSVKLSATEMGETRPFPETTAAGAPNKLPSGAIVRGQEPSTVESPCPESGVPGLCSHRQSEYNYLGGWPRC